MNGVSILGSPFEMSLRILIMLDVISDAELDEQKISAIDFIAVYAADFDLLDENLHGNGNYRFSEYPARKDLVKEALRMLVLDGTLSFHTSKKGFTYRITELGRNFCTKMTDSYVEEYRIAIMAVVDKYGTDNDRAMLSDISRRTIDSLQVKHNG